MRNFQNTLFAVLVGSMTLAQTACNTSNAMEESSLETKSELPQLLETEAEIGPSEERDFVSTRFMELEDRIEANSEDYEALLDLAEIYMMEARISGEHPYYYPAALAMINRVEEAMGGDNTDVLFRMYHLKSSVYLSLHQFEPALTAAEAAVSINPYDAGIYGALIDAHVELGDYEKAVAYADQMMSIRPDLRSYSRVSYLREIHGDLDGAIEAMKLAVAAGYPGYEQTCWARYTLGGLYESVGDLTNAEIQYRLALEERPQYAFALEGLASIAIKNNDLEKAETILNEAAATIPEVGFYQMLSDIYAATGREELAVETAQEVITMMKEDEASGHVMDLDMAYVYMDQLGDYDSALPLIQKEYDARPKNIDVNMAMAKYFYDTGDAVQAKSYMEVAQSTNKETSEFLLYSGLIQVKSGDNNGVADLESALMLNPYLSGVQAEEAREIINL